jgi:hypothetical protein
MAISFWIVGEGAAGSRQVKETRHAHEIVVARRSLSQCRPAGAVEGDPVDQIA